MLNECSLFDDSAKTPNRSVLATCPAGTRADLRGGPRPPGRGRRGNHTGTGRYSDTIDLDHTVFMLSHPHPHPHSPTDRNKQASGRGAFFARALARLPIALNTSFVYFTHCFSYNSTNRYAVARIVAADGRSYSILRTTLLYERSPSETNDNDVLRRREEGAGCENLTV